MEPSDFSSHWTFLSNHGHVLIAVSLDPGIRIAEIAARVGITERAVMNVLSDLQRSGVLEVTKKGRRNVYTVHTERPLRHPLERHRTVGDLIAMVRAERSGPSTPIGQGLPPEPRELPPSEPAPLQSTLGHVEVPTQAKPTAPYPEQ